MLGGIFPTVLTPWTDDDRLDEAALEAQVDDLIGNGVNGLVILGSIGESPLVSEGERDAIIARTLAAVHGRVPVIAGVTALGTKNAVEQVARGRALGLTASLVALPTYYDSSFDRVKQHYLAAAAAGPIFYYNYPAATRLRLSHDQVGEIISLPGVVGIKESVFDLEQIAAHIARSAGNRYFSVLSGSELDYLDVMRLGAHGAISAGAVVMPRTAVALHRAWLTNDMERAKKLQNQLFEALPCMVELGSSVAAARLGLQTALKNGKVPEGSVDTTIARLKHALALRGMPIKPHVRAPLAPLTERDRQAVSQAMLKISEIL